MRDAACRAAVGLVLLIVACGGGGGGGRDGGASLRTPTVTVTPAPTSVTSTQSLIVTIAVSGGSEGPTPAGTVTLTSGGYTSAGTPLSGGSATITVPAGSLGTGTDTLTATYVPDPASASTYRGATGTSTVTVTGSGGAAVNGACGGANGTAVTSTPMLTSAPPATLCATGTATPIAGSGPWTWSCAGANGGTTSACSAPVATTCVTPGPRDLYVDKDDPSASDGNDGHYGKDGGTGPFKTIQHLVDVLRPGQCGYVRQSATPYYENTFERGDFSGVTFTHGGTSDGNRVVVAGYPGERPVLDQQRAQPAARSGSSVVGFYIYQGSFITIRNFEVRNTTGPGISTNVGSVTSYINIESNLVHDTVGIGNPNNVGGIRVDYCHDCDVRNNTIHDLGDDDGQEGINAFQPGGVVLENNLIYNAHMGVQLKQADESSGLDAFVVRNNIFVNLGYSAYNMQVQGAAHLAAPHRAAFYNNVVYNSNGGVTADLQEAGEQASGLAIYNNTFVKTTEMAWIANFTGIEVYNNIDADWRSPNATSIGSTSIYDEVSPSPWKNQLSSFDNNCYFDVNPKWDLDIYAASEKTFTSLSAWQGASAVVGFSPDTASRFVDPMFVNAGGGSTKLLAGDVTDYALQGSSPGLTMGRGGGPVGAVRPGVTIGPVAHP